MIYRDQMNKLVELEEVPKRMVSLVPSQTELLFDLGLGDSLVGVTKFCLHPYQARKTKKIIGGTKKLNLKAIEALQPDLIIGNKEENTQAEIDYLSEKFPVWMSDIFTQNDVYEMVKSIGEMTNTSAQATILNHNLSQTFSNLPKLKIAKRFLYLIWHNPSMLAGKETYIDSFLTELGFINACSESRYPILNEVEMKNIDLVLLSSEPYPFKAVHLEHYKTLFPNAEVMLVDGEAFSWYGTRLLKVEPYLHEFLKHF